MDIALLGVSGFADGNVSLELAVASGLFEALDEQLSVLCAAPEAGELLAIRD